MTEHEFHELGRKAMYRRSRYGKDHRYWYLRAKQCGYDTRLMVYGPGTVLKIWEQMQP